MTAPSIESILDEAANAGKAGRPAEALKLAESLLERNDCEGSNRVKALHTSALGSMWLSQWDKCEEYARDGLKLAEELDDTLYKARIYSTLSSMYNRLGKFEETIACMNHAEEASRDQEDIVGIAVVHGNKANLYTRLGDYSTALDLYDSSYKLHRQIDNHNGMSLQLSNMASCYSYLKDNQKSLEYAQQAHDLNVEHNLSSHFTLSLSLLAMAYGEMEDYDKAIEYYERCIELDKKSQIPNDMCLDLGNIGGIYHQKKEFDKAIDFQQKALTIAEQIDATRPKISFNLGLSRSFGEMDPPQYDMSVKHAEKALSLARESESRHMQAKALHQLSELAFLQQDWENSARLFKDFYAIEEEVNSEEATVKSQQLDHRRRIENAERDRQLNLARFEEKERILHNILPLPIANRMAAGESLIADSCPEVSVFFSDIVGFTSWSSGVPATELVSLLNEIIREFDRLAEEHGMEKIKTIGDAYLAVCGAPEARDDHAERSARFARDVRKAVSDFKDPSGNPIQLRIGLHTGEVVTGIIGENRFAYDVWGDTVNTASRMESLCEKGQIHMSAEFAALLNDPSLDVGGLRETAVKGKESMQTCYLDYSA